MVIMSSEEGPSEDEKRTLWVGGISEQVDEELLYELFQNAGPLINVRIPVDRETKKQKPFAFVRFHHPESVPYAIELMRDVTLFGRSMRMQNKATGAGMGGRGGQYQQQRPPMPQFQPPQRQNSHESPRQEAAGLSSFQNNHQRSWSMPGTPVSVAQAAMMQQQQQQMMAQQMMMMGGGGGGGQGNPQMMAQQMMAMAQMQQMQQQQGHDGFGNFQQQQGFQQQQQQQDWRGGFDRDRGDGGGGRDNRGSSSTLYDRQRRDRDREQQHYDRDRSRNRDRSDWPSGYHGGGGGGGGGRRHYSRRSR